MTLLTVSNISKQINGNTVLRGISFQQNKLQKIAIAGETGSGKSTLLKVIAGLEQPDEGTVAFEKENVKGPDQNLVPGHPSIHYLSQQFSLQKNLRVDQILTYSNRLPSGKASQIYAVCRIEDLLDRRTDELSGGEIQRIALARILTAGPKLLLLDEPFSNLDMIQKNILKAVIDDIFINLRITPILVSHDPLDTLAWADEIIVMKDGAILQKGNPTEVYRNPENQYVAGLFGRYNVISSSTCRAFARNYRLDTTSELILRPENFKIVKKGLRAVKGVVESVKFYGSYSEAEVRLKDGQITVRGGVAKCHPGDRVLVSLTR